MITKHLFLRARTHKLFTGKKNHMNLLLVRNVRGKILRGIEGNVHGPNFLQKNFSLKNFKLFTAVYISKPDLTKIENERD